MCRVMLQFVPQDGKENVSCRVKSPQMPSTGWLSKSFSQTAEPPPPMVNEMPPTLVGEV